MEIAKIMPHIGIRNKRKGFDLYWYKNNEMAVPIKQPAAAYKIVLSIGCLICFYYISFSTLKMFDRLPKPIQKHLLLSLKLKLLQQRKEGKPYILFSE